MGASHGTGQPIRFFCAQCRSSRFWSGGPVRGDVANIVLTGKVRRAHARAGGARVSLYQFEYQCKDCGHVGWSRHIALERKYQSEGRPIPAGVELGPGGRFWPKTKED